MAIWKDRHAVLAKVDPEGGVGGGWLGGLWVLSASRLLLAVMAGMVATKVWFVTADCRQNKDLEWSTQPALKQRYWGYCRLATTDRKAAARAGFQVSPLLLALSSL